MPQYEFQYIPIDQLLPNPLRPRFKMDHEKLLKLADSIRQYGLFQPLLVGKTAAGLQIVAGERRWRAAKAAGLTEIPAMIFEASLVDLTLLFLEENLQRESVNLLEQATAMQNLLQKDLFKLDSLANRLKVDEEEINQVLETLSLPEKIKDFYLDGKISNQELIDLTKEEDPLVMLHKTNP